MSASSPGHSGMMNEVEMRNLAMPSNTGMQSGVREVDTPVAEYDTSTPDSPGSADNFLDEFGYFNNNIMVISI